MAEVSPPPERARWVNQRWYLDPLLYVLAIVVVRAITLLGDEALVVRARLLIGAGAIATALAMFAIRHAIRRARLGAPRGWAAGEIIGSVLVALALVGAGGAAAEETPPLSAADRAYIDSIINDVDRGVDSTVPAGVVTAPATTLSAPTPTTERPTTTAAGPRKVAEWSGTSTKNTPSFRVRDPWVIGWGVSDEGAGLIIKVYDEETRELIDAFEANGTDTTGMRVSCICYLRIETYGSAYRVVVYD